MPLEAALVELSKGRDTTPGSAKRIGHLLQERISDVVMGKDVLVPLSGGVDSRILLACTCKAVPAERIYAVTFGNSRSNIEVRLATEVCRVLGIRPPTLHILKPESYKTAAPVLARMSDGEIPPLHIHLLSFLTERGSEFPKLWVSGIGADAAAGYAQDANEDKLLGFDACMPARALKTAIKRLGLAGLSAASLRQSLACLYREYLELCIPISFAEYFYWVGRTNKTLLGLARVYELLGREVTMPFLDPEVFSSLACCDIRLRQNKRILREVLNAIDPRLLSVPFFSSSAGFEPLDARDHLTRIAANRFRLAVEFFSADRWSSPDPWECESLGRSMRTDLLPLLRSVLLEWQDVGLISETTSSILGKRHYRISAGIIQAQYAALGVALTASGLRDSGASN